MTLAQATQALREAIRIYNAKPEAEQKKERHELYQAEGNFGKLVVGMVKPFTELEAKVHKPDAEEAANA